MLYIDFPHSIPLNCMIQPEEVIFVNHEPATLSILPMNFLLLVFPKKVGSHFSYLILETLWMILGGFFSPIPREAL